MSILSEVKKFIPVHEDDDSFDIAIIMHINTAFFNLKQLGVGPADFPFAITGDTEDWTDFDCLPEQTEIVKMYVCMKVKLNFDTPTSTAVSTALKEAFMEVETRLHWNQDYGT